MGGRHQGLLPDPLEPSENSHSHREFLGWDGPPARRC